MKRLTLLRHAKSTWDDPVARDFDRPLNPRGRRAARAVGREMRAQGLEFDLVRASPAVRVMETLAEVVEGFGRGLDPQLDQRIYLASCASLLAIVQETDAEAESLLLIGHNPGLEMLALFLAGEEDGAIRDQIEIKYPTGTLVEIMLPIEKWSEAREGLGRLTRFIRPRDLDPALGPDEDTV